MSTQAAAKLMLDLFKQHGELRQDDAANQLHEQFGEEATYFNNNGNLAINREVLIAFNKLTPDAVWLRASRYWRTRQQGDEPSRQQPY